MPLRGSINIVNRFLADRSGAVLVEFTLVVLIMLTMTFGIVEFGYAGFQWANAEAATQRGVRLAATRSAAIAVTPDCGPGTNVTLGQPCSTDPTSYAWSLTCNAASTASGCNGPTLALIVAEMQRSYPKITSTNVNVTFSGAGLGFQGLGRPVPIVTVELTGLTFDFIALDGLIGLPDQINMPAFRTSLAAEDLEGA